MNYLICFYISMHGIIENEERKISLCNRDIKKRCIKECIALCQINKDNARETMVKERLYETLI